MGKKLQEKDNDMFYAFNAVCLKLNQLLCIIFMK